MRRATIVRAADPAMQVAAAGTLLAGAAGLADKVIDGDVRATTRGAAKRWSSRFAADGHRLARRTGLDAKPVLGAVTTAVALEQQPADASLEVLLAPSGTAVAAMFAATATAADRPDNAVALRRAGEAFGRLVHLGDAIDDLDVDLAKQRFNPLTATGTSRAEAAGLATALHGELLAALADVRMADRELADVLFGDVLAKTISRWQPAPATVPRPRAPLGALAGIAAVAFLGVFGGPRRGRYYGDPYYDPRYDPRYQRGYYGRGPSCCDMLACDCCANLACDEMCGGDCCVCCV